MSEERSSQRGIKAGASQPTESAVQPQPEKRVLGKEVLFKFSHNGLKLGVIKGSSDKEVSNDFGSFVCFFVFVFKWRRRERNFSVRGSAQ